MTQRASDTLLVQHGCLANGQTASLAIAGAGKWAVHRLARRVKRSHTVFPDPAQHAIGSDLVILHLGRTLERRLFRIKMDRLGALSRLGMRPVIRYRFALDDLGAAGLSPPTTKSAHVRSWLVARPDIPQSVRTPYVGVYAIC